MIEKKNFLRKPVLIKDFIEMSCLFMIVVCLIKLATKADTFLIILCVSVVSYVFLQIVDIILQKQDEENQETWN